MPCFTRTEDLGSSDSSHRDKYSLRFTSRLTEGFYVQTQKPNLLWYLKSVLASGIIIELGFLARFLMLAAQAQTALAKETYQLNLSIDIGLLALNTVICLIITWPQVASAMPPVAVEALTLAVFCVHTVLVLPLGFWYAARLLGHDPASTWGHGSERSETRPLLSLSALIMLVHLMPIRWIMLAPLEVLTLLTYAAFAFGLGGPDGSFAWSNLSILAAMIALTAVGRRNMEQLQRASLYELIRERHLRVQTEFRLEQRGGRAPAPSPGSRQEDLSSAYESRPETTVSAAVFADPDLQRVVELGTREQWYIHPSELTLTSEVLGEGSFGLVVVGSFHGSPVAVKMARMREAPGSGHRGILSSFLTEVKILRRLRHPNIVLFHGASISRPDNEVGLVLELLRGVPLTAAVLEGDLQKQPLPPSHLLRALLDVCLALRYLHSRQPAVIHGDLKPHNIHVEMASGSPGLLRAKLLDFGLSRLLTQHAGHMTSGTLEWAAPEVVRGRSAPKLASDVFSFGRLAFFTLTGKSPCQVSSRATLHQQLRMGWVQELPWPPDASALAGASRALVEACSSTEAGCRPTIAEAYRQLKALEGGGFAPIEVAFELHSEAPEPHSEAPGGPPAPSAPPEGMREDPGEEEEEEPWLPLFEATPASTQHALLLKVMGRVNLARKGGQCCALHAGVANLRGMLRELRALVCQELPPVPVTGQCPVCGTLLHARDAAKASAAAGAQPREAGGAPRRCPVCADNMGAAVRVGL